MTLAVVIPTYGRTVEPARLLACLARQSLAPDEVIVVDQNAAGLLDPLLAESGIGPILHLRLAEPNAAAARNAGFAASTSTHVLFLDDDETVEPDFIARLSKSFAAHPEVGCLWPIVYEGSPRAAARRWRRRVSPSGSLIPVRHAGAGGIAFERGCFRAAGGYDELLFEMGGMGEDWELSLRMRHRELTIWLDPSLRVRHGLAVEGGCAIRSAPYRDTRARLLRMLLAALRASAGAPFSLTLRHLWPALRVGLLSSLGRPGGRAAVLLHPIWHLRAALRAIGESRDFVRRHASLYAEPWRVNHLDAPTYKVASSKRLGRQRVSTLFDSVDASGLVSRR